MGVIVWVMLFCDMRWGNGPGGALFTFVEGTDPEVFLLLEARVRDKGPTWHYALARMNSCEFRVAQGGREIWSVPLISWSRARDTSEPYALITLPDGGINPGDAPPER